MAYATIIAMLALIEYFYFGIQVGGARARTGVKAPAVAGNEEFERFFRASYANGVSFYNMAYPNFSHQDADIDETLERVERGLAAL